MLNYFLLKLMMCLLFMCLTVGMKKSEENCSLAYSVKSYFYLKNPGSFLFIRKR